MRLAKLKRTSAHDRFPGNGANAATQNKPVSAKRETVNWLGRFIGRFSVSCSGGTQRVVFDAGKLRMVFKRVSISDSDPIVIRK